LLLVATAFLGVGFGMTVPALNTLTAAFHRDSVESSVLVLNALLGLPAIYAAAAGIAAGMGLLSFAVARRGVGTELDIHRPRAGLAS
jgi:hypothetical protein